jgi:nucleoside-triphosphatase
MPKNPKNLVLTGKPGVGKTTLVKEAVWPFRESVGGFYTEEVVEARQRLGFRLKSFSGAAGLLSSKLLASPHRVGKYGVDLEVLERVGVESLRSAVEKNRLIVIDEIGSMEILSAGFRSVVLQCLTGPSPVLATIRFGAQPFTDSIKTLPSTELVELTRANYPEVRGEVRSWVEAAIESYGQA